MPGPTPAHRWGLWVNSYGSAKLANQLQAMPALRRSGLLVKGTRSFSWQNCKLSCLVIKPGQEPEYRFLLEALRLALLTSLSFTGASRAIRDEGGSKCWQRLGSCIAQLKATMLIRYCNHTLVSMMGYRRNVPRQRRRHDKGQRLKSHPPATKPPKSAIRHKPTVRALTQASV